MMMKNLTDPAKLHPPRYLEEARRATVAPSPRVFERPRLLDWLQEQPAGKTVCLVAPEGSGKTTLVSCWILSGRERHTPLHLAWLTLDPGDNDAVRFLHSLAGAFQKAQPGLGASVTADIDMPQQPDLLGLLAHLLLEIAASRLPITFVLDNCHTITALRIQKALAYLSSHVPSNMQLILISDRDLPEPIETERQKGMWEFLDYESLRLSPDETMSFLNEVSAAQINEEQSRLLTTRTQGLALAIHLAGLALQNHTDPGLFWKGLLGPDILVLEYLLDQALMHQMESVREFLFFTSILDRMSGPLCDHVLRASPSGLQTAGRGQASLEHLSKSQFFTYSLDADKKWFQYHPTIAGILLERLARNFSGSLGTLHQRASQWCELNHELEAAIRHALEANDDERAAVLVELNALEWAGSGQFSTSLRWLGCLPAGLVLLRPWLCLTEAWASTEEGWQQGTETLLSVVETAATSMPPAAAQRAQGHAAAVRLRIASDQMDLRQKEALARRALELLPPQDRSIRCQVAQQLGIDLQQAGRLGPAAEVLTEAIACARQGDNPAVAVLSYCRLSDLHLVEGLLQKVLALSEEALFIAQSHAVEEGFPLVQAGLAHLYGGIVLYERDELEVAQSHFENCIAHCEAWGLPEFIALGQAYLAEALHARGNASFAQQTVAQAQANLENMQRLKIELEMQDHKEYSSYLLTQPVYIQAKLASLYLAGNEGDKASAWLDQSEYSSSDQFTFFQAPIYLTIVQVLIAQNRVLEARRLLRHLASVCEVAGAQYGLIRALAMQAQLMQQSNDYQSALVTLKRALLLAEPENYIRTFIDGNPDIDLLLRRIGEGGPSSAYARSILAAKERQAQRTVGSMEPIPLSTRPLTRPLAPIDKMTRETFSDREKEVLRFLGSYLTEAEISYRLSISTRTVDTLVRNICRKLGVQDAKQAIARARELKII
jgi:LuxR family transcriptional regulator, maltose regulon positive regulatory protein